jgi:IS30 family transposase
MEITKQNLQKLYIEDRYTVQQIAIFFNKSIATISRSLKKFSIQTRPFTEKGRVSWNKGIPMRKSSREKLSKSHMGKKLSLEHRNKVIKTLQYGQKGAENPMWNEGKYINPSGYVYLRLADHPHKQSNGYMAEHRYVVEQLLGRYLTKWEHVHHINGIKGDNRPENLELVNAQTHNLITMMEIRIKELETEVNDLKQLLSA